ncbi:MAG: rod shape-determining protein RodA, partial [Acidobacteria bacterium]|nr:rod shape-determining protein RodA [Acidobacteriota bacterium]
MFERRLYHHVDWALLAAVLALCTIGVVMIYSTTADPTRASSHMHVTQFYAIVIGLAAMALMLMFDYRTFTDKSHIIYILLLAVLVYVMFFGKVQMGARRWIPLKVFNLQPSEFAKIGVALVLAKFFGENRGAPGWADLAIGGTLTAIPIALIAKQPDLGTAVVLVPVFLAIAYLAGMRMRVLGVLCVCGLLAAPVAWRFMKDYQRSRISTFLDPSQDAKGAGYQQIQARITVGSGGLSGKGFTRGTQGQLRFLPVAHNDFIFSVLAEEQGFAGVLVALGLYLFVILRTLEAARLAKDRLGSYLVL